MGCLSAGDALYPEGFVPRDLDQEEDDQQSEQEKVVTTT